MSSTPPTAAAAPPSAMVDAGGRPGLPRCARGYRSGGDPHLDGVRLGALCGPSHGLALEPAWVFAARDQGELAHVELDEDECVWVVASAPADTDLDLQWVAGPRVMASCELKGMGWCPRFEPLCARSSLELSLQTGDTGGRAAPEVVFWTRRRPRRVAPPTQAGGP